MNSILWQNLIILCTAMTAVAACDDEDTSSVRGSTTKSEISTKELESALATSLKDAGIGLSDVELIVKAFVDGAMQEQTRLKLAGTSSTEAEIGLNALSVGYRAGAEFAVNTGSMNVPGYASIASGLGEGALTFWLMETGSSGVPDIKILLREMIRTLINIKSSRKDISDNVLANAVGKMNAAVRIASFSRNEIDDPALIIDATSVVATELGSSLDAGQINANIYTSSIRSIASNGAVSITTGMDLETLVKMLLETLSDDSLRDSAESTLMADVAAIAARAFTNSDDSVRSKMRETLWAILDKLKKEGEISTADFDAGMAHFDAEVVKPLDNTGAGSSNGSGSGSTSGSGSGSTATASKLPSSISVVPQFSTTSTAVSDTYWNKYVDGSIPSLNCDPDTSVSCYHAGEYRKVVLDGVASCDGITATDSQVAFAWICEVEAGKAVVKSTGLVMKKGLRDLVTTSGWKDMSVTVQLGNQSVTSPPSAWWTNEVQVFPTTPTAIVMTAYKIYVVGANISWPSGTQLSFTGDGTALVTIGNVVFTSAAPLSFMKDFTWIEVKHEYNGTSIYTVNADGGYNTVRNSHFNNAITNELSVIDFYGNGNRFINSTIQHSSMPYIGGSCQPGSHADLRFTGSYNQTMNARIAKACAAVSISGGNRNRVINSKVTQSNYGLYLQASDTLVQNNEFSGGTIAIQNWTSGNVFVGNFVVSAQTVAVQDSAGSGAESTPSSSMFGQNTILNSGTGVYIGRSDSRSLQNFVAANTSDGIQILNNTQNYLIQDTLSLADSTNTQGINVLIASMGNNVATGTIVSSRIGRCSTNISSNSSCISSETSTLISSSFMGRVTSGDSDNAHNGALQIGSGVMDKASIQDWFYFSQPFRVFVNYGESYNQLSAETRKNCDGTNCALMDYGIKTNSSAILNTLPCPSANSSLNHTFFRNVSNTSDDVQATFLVRAQEIFGDRLGNDNGLCEQGETCLRVKNYGAYQGHGNLVASSCPALTGAFDQVKLLEYTTNGF